MLGRLLHLGTGGGQSPTAAAASQTPVKPVTALESVQEDIHTRNLLFPDTQALWQHRNDQVFPLSSTVSTVSSSAYDFSDDTELDVRDVRILVLQDTLGSAQTSLLFDSHPVSAGSQSPVRSERPHSSLDPRVSATTSRKSSLSQGVRPLSISQNDIVSPRSGVFDRRPSVPGHSRGQSQSDLAAQRAIREYREELATFSSCIFGNSELMAYKGTSTKVHVVPADQRQSEPAVTSVFGDGRTSIGRTTGRSSKLSQSLSSRAVSPPNPLQLPPGSGARVTDRKKVLITRLFPVNLPSDGSESSAKSASIPDDPSSFPFPATEDDPRLKKKRSQPKQRRTPMYAVVLVVQLPSASAASSRLSPAATGKNAFRESGSYNEQDLFPSSYNSSRLAGWNAFGSSSAGGDLADSLYSTDGEDRMEMLTQHWDIIVRTLTHLQSVVASKLFTMLKQVDIASPGPTAASVPSSYTSRPSPLAERRSIDAQRIKPAKSTIKLVSLWANCLTGDESIQTQVEQARNRIVRGLSAGRVVTGQGRWGIWRDELIWASRWLNSLNEGAFLHRLLTGFLATHIDWIQALSPPFYRRRNYQGRRNKADEDLALPARTIIVSDNKMAARRLVFLLAAFLPASQQISANRAHRLSTSTSVGTYSHSPPKFVIPVLRDESLRRKINRRSGLQRTSQPRATTQSSKNAPGPTPLANVASDRRHERRVSDAGSIKTTNFLISGNESISRKSTAATTTIVVSLTTKPHFASAQQTDWPQKLRPDSSSSSMAADDLKRSLRRSESSGLANTSISEQKNQGSRWGSLINGLWATRRSDLTDSDPVTSSIDQEGSSSSATRRPSDLAQMVQEAIQDDEQSVPTPSTPVAPVQSQPEEQISGKGSSFVHQEDRTPYPSGAFDSPVKTTINAEDGVIDVDVPFPDYMASFESAISSPSSSGYLSAPGIAPGLDAFEHAARLPLDGDIPLNAAGWLGAFHPDFILQAIPPQEDLKERVKACLRAEPTPEPLVDGFAISTQRWVNVGSVLIADTTAHTVTRLQYRRLVKSRSASEHITGAASAGSPAMPSYPDSALLTPSILPYETPLEEEWVEDVIAVADEGLVDATERIIHLGSGPDHSKVSSSASSQMFDESRGSMSSDHALARVLTDTTELPDPSLGAENPRVQCKSIMLSALADAIQSAADDRRAREGRRKGNDTSPTPNFLREAVSDWLSHSDVAEE